MRLAVSHTYFNKKLEEFGHGHDDDIRRIMELEKKQLHKGFPTSEPAKFAVDADDSIDGNSGLSDASRSILAQCLSIIKDNPYPDLEIDFAIPVMKNCIRKF